MNRSITKYYTSTMETCRNEIYNKMASLSRPQTLVTNDRMDFSCITATLVTSTTLAIIGIIFNTVNIVTFTNKIIKGLREQATFLFLAVAVSDLILLLIQLPQLAMRISHEQLTVNKQTAYNKYIIFRYAMNYVCTMCSTWLLVAIFILQLQQKEQEEMTEDRYWSDELSDNSCSDTNDTKHGRRQGITIVAIAVVCTGIHIIKAFELEQIDHKNLSVRLQRKPSYNVLWYQIYSLIANLIFTHCVPYVINIIAAIYFLYFILMLKWRGRGDNKMKAMLLCFTLSFFYCLCYSAVVYLPIIQLVQHTRTYKYPCLENINESLVYLYCAIKLILYICFTSMRKNLFRYKWKKTFLSSIHLRNHSVTLAPPLQKPGDGESVTNL